MSRKTISAAAACLPLLFASCASVPATVAQAEITGILDSGVLDPAHIITAEEKTKLRLALMHSREGIGAAEERREKAEKKAESSATWATRGKVGAGLLGGLAVLAALAAVAGIIRKFSIFG